MSDTPDKRSRLASGVVGPWGLTVSQADQVIEERTFTEAFALAGRGEGNSLRLPDPTIRQRHAYFQALPGGLLCVDIGSGDGLQWPDGNRLYGWLRPDQSVKIGPYSLALQPQAPQEWLAPSNWLKCDPMLDHISEASHLPPVIVKVLDEGEILARWEMRRLVALVGRLPRCSVRLGHKSVSQCHCSLVRTTVGLWVIDLLSKEGTFLNNQRVTCQRVQPGDRVRVGKFTLQFGPVRTKMSSVATSPPILTAPGGAPSEDEADGPAKMTRSTALIVPGGESPAEAAGALLAGTANEAQTPLLLAVMNQFSQMQQQMFEQLNQNMMMMAGFMTTMHQEQMSLVRGELDHLHRITDELRTLQDQLRCQGAPASPEVAPELPDASDEMVETSSPVEEVDAAAPIPAPPPLPPPPGKEPTDEVHSWLTHRIADLNQERQSRWKGLLGILLRK